MSITPTQLARLQERIDAGRQDLFYGWKSWKRLSKYVREKMDNRECQYCKARGRYRRGYIVHHVKHLDERPDLALSIFDPDTGERQLVTLCKDCHEEQHPESLVICPKQAEFLTEERWD